MGDNIRQARERAGLTRDAVASEIGTTAQHLYAWERGRYKPSSKYIGPLAKALGVSIHELYGEGPSLEETALKIFQELAKDPAFRQIAEHIRGADPGDVALLAEVLRQLLSGPPEFRRGIQSLLELVRRLNPEQGPP